MEQELQELRIAWLSLVNRMLLQGKQVLAEVGKRIPACKLRYHCEQYCSGIHPVHYLGMDSAEGKRCQNAGRTLLCYI